MKPEFRLERNKSITYILPIFAQYVPISYFKLLVNTYLWYDDIKDESFCLLYKFDGRVKGKFNSRQGFTVYEEKSLARSRYYVGSLDYGQYVMYQFVLPIQMIDVRNLFIEGKYSKFSQPDKDRILDFISNVYGPNERNHIARILYRDPEMRDELGEKLGLVLPDNAELSSQPYIKKEVFANAFIKELKLEENEK